MKNICEKHDYAQCDTVRSWTARSIKLRGVKQFDLIFENFKLQDFKGLCNDISKIFRK